MGGYKHKPSAAALATPYTELTLALTPSSGTPSSILHDATLDAGLLNGWVVGNPESKLTGAVDNGTTQDLVLAQDNLGDGDWGQSQDPTQKGVFLRLRRRDLPEGAYVRFGPAVCVQRIRAHRLDNAGRTARDAVRHQQQHGVEHRREHLLRCGRGDHGPS